MQESKLLFHELPPFFDNDSETLILGSFPSPKSRECGFYYGHPQNRFWKTLAAVFEEEIPVNIEEKKEFLRRQKIALWDVIASCEIKGAEDGSIRRAKANDLSVILNAAAIRKILTTGKTAFCLYQTLCEPIVRRPALPLPSTSPANRAVSFEELVCRYREALL